MSNGSSDDDDIPGLESVSSSEYVDDSDSGSELSDLGDDDAAPVIPRWVDPSSPSYVTAKKWLAQDLEAIKKHLQVIAVYMFSPFLYGHAHQSDKWLGWCSQVGLLLSDTNYNTGELCNLECSAVDVLEKAMEWCRNCMREGIHPDNLALLLQLADDIKPVSTMEKAVKLAKKRGWYMAMLQGFDGRRVGNVTNDMVGKNNFVEVGCLYAVNQTAEHVQGYVTKSHDFVKEFDDQCTQDEKKFDPMKRKGDELYKQGKHEEAIDEYSNAILCCPYNYRLYSNRALCYLELKQPKAALADGLRAVYLKPDWPKGHARYLQALNACGEVQRAQTAYKRYMQLFPGQKDQNLLRMAMDTLPGSKEKKKIEPTEEDKVLKEKVMGFCKQASEGYLQGNNGEALFYYEEAIRIAEQNKGWQHCMMLSECVKFLVSLYYAYGCALLRKGTYEAAESALQQFDTVVMEYPSLKFPPAYYGYAKAFVMLHRHSEALILAKQGLELLASYKPQTVTWPGVEEAIQDCLPQNIEIKLQQLQQQCEPVCLPDAVCRYDNCLQHHTSANIRIEDLDYKGHVVMHCSESCAIAYHTSCWRRFKTDHVSVNTDRDFLLTSCLTPDCKGSIKMVVVFDQKGPKIKFEAPPEALVKKLPQLAAAAPSKEGHVKPAVTKKEKLRKKKTADSGKEEPQPQCKTPQEEKPPLEEKAVEERSPEVTSEGEEKGVKKASEISEDSRKAEDSLAVINRQAEQEDTKDATVKAKTKAKKKKSRPREKEREREPDSASEPWTNLFTLPERKGLLGESSCLSDHEEAGKGAWQLDPDAPFQPPAHLRDAIDAFENTEVPAMGLPPRPLTTSNPNAWTQKSEEGLPPTTSSEDFEFIYSYFAEIFKTHGALRSDDPNLTEPMTFLPEDKKEIISNSGGLAKFLLRSPLFKSHGNLICLAEDAPVVAASIGSGNGDGNSSNKKKSKPSLGALISEHQRQPQQTVENLSEMESLKFDEGQLQDERSSRTYGEELGSGLNSPVSPLDSPMLAKKLHVRNVSEGQLDRKLRTLKVAATSSVVDSSGARNGGRRKGFSPPSSQNLYSQPLSAKDTIGSQEVPSQTSTSVDHFSLYSSTNSEEGPILESLFEGSGSGRETTKDREKEREKDKRRRDKEREIEWEKERESEREKKREEGERERKKEEGEREKKREEGEREKKREEKEREGEKAKEREEKEKEDEREKKREETERGPAKTAAVSVEENSVVVRTSPKLGGERERGKVEPAAMSLSPPPVISQYTQTDPPLLTEKWAQTDPLPPVENYKERYEKAFKEKKDLQVKLEESEDRRYKLQRDHKRELERLQKRSKQEAKEEGESRVRDLEARMVEENKKVQQEKKEQMDQIRSLKAEIKSLTDKIERLKKDISKKDHQIDTNFAQFQAELERALNEKKRAEDRARVAQELNQKALQRAVGAEVELVNLRKEFVLRPGEQRLQEIDRICGHQLVPGSDIHREWLAYKEKLKTSLECFQNAMDDQVRQVKGGRELSSLDRVPNPAVPLPPQLRMPFMMRPPFPMMPVRGPGPPQVDPASLQGIPPPPQGMPPLPQGILPQSQGLPPQPKGMSSGVIPPPPQGVTALPPVPTLPRNVDSAVGAVGGVAVVPEPELISPAASSGKVVKSSFNRIVEKLAPLYPHYSRDDFKMVLREVRRNNNNTLSGLSMDSIAYQVKDVIDLRERAKGGGTLKQLAGRQLKRLPPVAVAPPPTFSSVVYDDEGSCIICYEDMDDFDSSRLGCGHRFHTDCIRSWFKEQSTCPTCRNHALLPEEYPFLGHKQ